MKRWTQTWPSALVSGMTAGVLSMLALAWRGRVDGVGSWAPLNAPGHWFWGDRAIHERRLRARFSVPGVLVHQMSALFWAVLFERFVRGRRDDSDPWVTARDAAAMTAGAALVDLKLTPERLTPGFERHLTRESLGWVYGAFALGLALGSWYATSQER